MKPIVSSFAMNDAVWQRHANPLSVWTRLPILPLLALAIWSRVWIGWACLIPVLALLAWTWLNPRAFPPPARTDSWASRAVMGERVWLKHPTPPIPAHHIRAARLLSTLSALGLPPLAWGLAVLDPWAVTTGLALTLTGKLWFLDRMVWIFDDACRVHDQYSAWLLPPRIEGQD